MPPPNDASLARFDPRRFAKQDGQTARKQVRWRDGSPAQSSPPGSQPSPLNKPTAGSHPQSLSRAGGVHNVSSWFVVVVILSYLIVRDGWFSLFMRQASSRISYLAPLAQWHFPLPPPSMHTLSPEIRKHIDDYLTRHSRGAILLRDFALSADGAIISPEFTSSHHLSDPSLVLNDDNRIGNCWRIPATHGHVGIVLPEFIYPTNVSIDHIPAEVAANPGQAPRRMILWGVVDGDRNTALYHQFTDELRADLMIDRVVPPVVLKGEVELYVVLSEFEYNIHAPALVQTFPVRSVVQHLDIDFGQVILEILSNWGADSTCLYRVRIHGETSTSK